MLDSTISAKGEDDYIVPFRCGLNDCPPTTIVALPYLRQSRRSGRHSQLILVGIEGRARACTRQFDLYQTQESLHEAKSENLLRIRF